MIDDSMNIRIELVYTSEPSRICSCIIIIFKCVKRVQKMVLGAVLLIIVFGFWFLVFIVGWVGLLENDETCPVVYILTRIFCFFFF